MRSATRTLISAAGLARFWLALAVLAAAAGLFAARDASAQAAKTTLTQAELADLVGPIALYPDDLVAIVLPASTYPLQVVEAGRLLEARKSDASLEPDADWDDSVVALLNYPEVVELLNDDLDWTYDLGTAVLNQRADVLDAIQGFRDRAYAAGNLRSDDRQTVSANEGRIAIKPADPAIIYVPYYEPERVIVYQRAPVYHYYPIGYPVYYYPYPLGYTFRTGYFWGVTSAFVIGWDTHLLHVHHHHYHGHPYFGRVYYDPFYVRNRVFVGGGYTTVWQPRLRYGGRPVVRGREGYVSTYTPRVNRGHTRPTAPAYRDGAPGSRRVQTTERVRPTPRPDVRRQATEGRGTAQSPSTTTRPRTEGTYRQGTGQSNNRNGVQAPDRYRSLPQSGSATQQGGASRVAPNVQQRAPRADDGGTSRNNAVPNGAAPRTREGGGTIVNRSYTREAAPAQGRDNTPRATPPGRNTAPQAAPPTRPQADGATRFAAPRSDAPRESYRGGSSGGANRATSGAYRSGGNAGATRSQGGGGYRGGQGSRGPQR